MQSYIIKGFILPFIMDFISKLLTRDNFKVWADRIFDLMEDAVKDSKTKTDDMIALPVIEHMRAILNVPDND